MFVTFIKQLSFRTKLIGFVGSAIVLVAGISLFSSWFEFRGNAKQQTVSQAKVILDLAQSTREQMAHRWERGVFQQEQLRKWADEGELDLVLDTVPIVAAWKTIEDAANEGEFSFRSPRNNPRNPRNEPDEIDRMALDRFAKDPSLNDFVYEDTANNAIRYLRPVRLTGECLRCHGDPDTSESLWGNPHGLDGTGTKMEGLKAGDLYAAFAISQSLKPAQDRAMAQMFQMLVIILCSSGVALFFIGWLLQKMAIRPLLEMSDTCTRLASGDLNTHVSITHSDEFGILQNGISQLVDRMRGLVLKLKNQSIDNSSQAMDLDSGLSLTPMEASDELSNAVAGMRDAINVVTNDVSAVATATNQIQNTVESVEGNTRVTAESAQAASALASEGTTHIRELSEAARGIGEIIVVIEEIAAQSNLLSLNAMIEASRASEHGRGFLVVANEVKELSKQTSESTEKIRTQIGAIQNISERAMKSILQIETAIQSVSDRASETSVAVQEQRLAVNSISEKVSNTAQASENLLSKVNTSLETAKIVRNKISDVTVLADEFLCK